MRRTETLAVSRRSPGNFGPGPRKIPCLLFSFLAKMNRVIVFKVFVEAHDCCSVVNKLKLEQSL